MVAPSGNIARRNEQPDVKITLSLAKREFDEDRIECHVLNLMCHPA